MRRHESNEGRCIKANKYAFLAKANVFIRFLLAGLPAFLLAVPANAFFVECLNLNKLLAYAVVLLAQVSMNFFICLLFVFKRDKEKSLVSLYLQFVSGIILIRFLDWSVYGFLVEIAGFYYLFVQIFNVLVFSVFKFTFSRRTIEGALPPAMNHSHTRERKQLG